MMSTWNISHSLDVIVLFSIFFIQNWNAKTFFFYYTLFIIIFFQIRLYIFNSYILWLLSNAIFTQALFFVRSKIKFAQSFWFFSALNLILYTIFFLCPFKLHVNYYKSRSTKLVLRSISANFWQLLTIIKMVKT